ncbi:MAG: DUF2341 domain-containing protein, partial [Verrucomicrobiota bacterium]
TDVGPSSATLNGELISTGTAPSSVTLYWGTNDAGRTPMGWDASLQLGPRDVGPLSTLVSGLVQNTTYFYRYFASNNIGGTWSVPPAGFKTLGPPVVMNVGVIPAVGQAETLGLLANGTMADVTIFWGTSDGGTNPASWADRVDLGPRPEGAFATALAGLLHGHCYAFRSYASNLAGEAWASTSVIFNPLPPTGVVYALVNRAATNITSSSATLEATLHTPGAFFDLTLFWGTNPAAWAHTQFVGSFSNAVNLDVEAELTNLPRAAELSYTFQAGNCLETILAAPPSQFIVDPGPVMPSDFTYNAKLTFCEYQKTEVLSNFTTLIDLGPHIGGFAYDQLHPAGNDLRFVDAGGNELNLEIDTWDTNGTSKVWVRIPELADVTCIFAYWGN